MGRVITVANRKGGVGKTTLVVSMAHAITADVGKSVCVIDLDPQASATTALLGTRARDFESLYIEWLLVRPMPTGRRIAASDIVIGQVSHLTNKPNVPLALLPCSPKLWALEDKIREKRFLPPYSRRSVRDRFARILRMIRGKFDYVLIDTPPGRGLLSDSAAKLADFILVPSNADAMGTWGLDLYEHELTALGAQRKARWIWTLMNPISDWRRNIEGFIARTHVRSISKTTKNIANTDFEDLTIFPKIAAIGFAQGDWTPRTFVKMYGETGAARISDVARYVMATTEEVAG